MNILTTRREFGKRIHAQTLGPRMCGNLEELAGWLQSANLEWARNNPPSMARQCSECNGSGDCSTCKGRQCEDCYYLGICPDCMGAGWVND